MRLTAPKLGFWVLIAVNALFAAQAAQAQRTTTGPVPPPGIDRGFRDQTRLQVVIPDVPAYTWHHGCGPTATGMVVGYWDGQGFPDLVPGSAATQTPAVNAMITDDSGQPNCSLPDGDHYQDYSCPLDTYGPIQPDRSELGGAHNSNCVGDFMRTSWSIAGNRYGWSYGSDIVPAFEQYVQCQTAYEPTAQDHPFYSFSWQRYMNEIDANRPMTLIVDINGDGVTDHLITAVGYNDATGQYGCHDTWDGSVHWFEWRQMSPGSPWGIASVYTFRLTMVYFMHADGSGDFPTIQAAIDACTSDELILLSDGVYTGDGNRDLDFLGKPITVRSLMTDPAACIIDCQGSELDPHRGFYFHGGEGSGSVLNAVTIANGYLSGTDGAGVYCTGSSSPTLKNCVFCGHTADAGAGIRIESSAPTLENCTFYGNSAGTYGSAASCLDGTPGFYNCTMADNAASEGGGLHCEGTAHPTLDNTIIAFNAGGAAVYCETGGTCTLTCSDIYGNEGGDWVGEIAGQLGLNGNICEDPLFCGLPVGEFTLRDESPCAPFSPPNEECDLIGAWPTGCNEYACCVGEVCEILSMAACTDAGGEWMEGIDSCDPNPCPLRACCIEEACEVLNMLDCLVAGGEWLDDVETCDPNPCLPYADLFGGCMIVHYVPEMEWTDNAPPEGWCQNYSDNFALAQSQDQLTRIDYAAQTSMWFILGAWDQSKEFCGVQFGFDDYNPAAYAFYEDGPCFPSGGLMLPSANWPGPNEGVGLVVTGDPWFGNYVPVYYFAGYAYSDETLIALCADSTIAVPFGGFRNCEESPSAWDAACFGAMGINQDGIECHPAGGPKVCCVGVECFIVSQGECTDMGGVWHEELDTCDPNPCTSDIDERYRVSVSMLLAPRPNPFSQSTVLPYHLEQSGQVRIEIYDTCGRIVRNLLSTWAEAGSGAVEWDGRDDLGHRAGAGTYFCRLAANGSIVSQRMVVIE